MWVGEQAIPILFPLSVQPSLFNTCSKLTKKENQQTDFQTENEILLFLHSFIQGILISYSLHVLGIQQKAKVYRTPALMDLIF